MNNECNYQLNKYNQVKSWLRQMLNRISAVQECDATMMNRITNDGNQNIF